MSKRKKQPGNGPTDPARARKVLKALKDAYPDAHLFLDYDNPFQLLIVTILAAQCTDERVNQVSPALFKKYPTPADIAEADRDDIEELIRSTGFYRQKAESIQECSRVIAEEHGGKVPDDLEALTAIKGVGRKTANIVLAEAFGQQAIAVDTHVKRVSTRIGLADATDPDKIERQLCDVLPKDEWSHATLVMGTHGRTVCTARKPDHESCPVRDLCDYYRDEVKG